MTALTVFTLAIAALVLVPGVIALRLNGVVSRTSPGPIRRICHSLSPGPATTNDHHALPELRTHAYRVSPDTLFDQVSLACGRLGWRLARQSSDSLTIEARTPGNLMGQSGQVTAVVTPTRSGAILNVRAQTRPGALSFGADTRLVCCLIESLRDFEGVEVLAAKHLPETVRHETPVIDLLPLPTPGHTENAPTVPEHRPLSTF